MEKTLKRPAVTVIMPAYNAGSFIGKAIESLKRQTLPDWELIVVDDCSTDDTGTVVKALAAQDNRIIYQRMPENKGPGAARNLGLSLMRGAWVTVLDSDDRYEPDRLQFLLGQASSLQADIVTDNLHCYDQSAGKIIRKAFAIKGEKLLLTPERLVANDGPPRLFSCGMLRPFINAAFLRKTGVVYNEAFRVGEDFCLLFSLLKKGGKAYILDKAGYIYTLPFGTQSRRESTTSRTDYHHKGWDRLIRSNDELVKTTLREMPANSELILLLNKRRISFVREKAWQDVKFFFRKKQIISLIDTVMRVNLLPSIGGKIANLFKESQAVI